jgi:hypothetical protein
MKTSALLNEIIFPDANNLLRTKKTEKIKRLKKIKATLIFPSHIISAIIIITRNEIFFRVSVLNIEIPLMKKVGARSNKRKRDR